MKSVREFVILCSGRWLKIEVTHGKKPSFCGISAAAATLRVDHERPPPGVVHHDAVINRERVDRQPRDVPRPDLDRVAQRRVQRERLGAGDLLLVALLHPVTDAVLPVNNTQHNEDLRYNGTPPYGHPDITVTPILRSPRYYGHYSQPVGPNPQSFFYLETPLIQPPRYSGTPPYGHPHRYCGHYPHRIGPNPKPFSYLETPLIQPSR